MLWLVERWQTRNVISLVLWPLSLLYCALAVVKRWLYISHILPGYTLDVPVVVVGNITVGGTGKTPFVVWLAYWLKSQGKQPGIVLRGYGGKSNTWPLTVTETTSASEAGDEAVLLARQTGCPVVAAPDRVAAIRTLLSEHECNIVISDDGLQHYRMRRDLEIAVVDGVRRFGNGFCLPAGPLREPRWRAKHADLVVINGDHEDDELGMTIEAAGFRNLASGETVGPQHFIDRPAVHAIAGIGNPERFFSTLRQLGLQSRNHPFPDHFRFASTDICPDEAGDVIMTEKDAVKCESFADKRHWALMVGAKPDTRLMKRLTDWLENEIG
jgi:tetraacyldisaccharide 4'-kinase